MQKGYVEMNRYIALQKAVELGSLTKAAEVLGYTQPAMSQMITSLERELSIKLLYRSRYGSRLTIEGERLFPSIQKTVAQYQAMQEIAKETSSRYAGQVVEVLAEEKNHQEEGYLTGRLSNNLLVHFKGGESLIGKLVSVHLTESRGFYYMGELV